MKLPPLKDSWVRTFTEDPKRIYQGDTRLGQSEEDALKQREAKKKARKVSHGR